MLVEQIMDPGVVAINANDTVSNAAVVMNEHDIGSLPVVSEGRILGVLSDRDIVIRAVSARLDPKTLKVRQIMSGRPAWCRSNDTVEHAAEVMQQRRVRRLLVVDHRARLIGILSLGDLARQGKDEKLAGAVLREVCRKAPKMDSAWSPEKGEIGGFIAEQKMESSERKGQDQCQP